MNKPNVLIPDEEKEARLFLAGWKKDTGGGAYERCVWSPPFKSIHNLFLWSLDEAYEIFDRECKEAVLLLHGWKKHTNVHWLSPDRSLGHGWYYVDVAYEKQMERNREQSKEEAQDHARGRTS